MKYWSEKKTCKKKNFFSQVLSCCLRDWSARLRLQFPFLVLRWWSFLILRSETLHSEDMAGAGKQGWDLLFAWIGKVINLPQLRIEECVFQRRWKENNRAGRRKSRCGDRRWAWWPFWPGFGELPPSITYSYLHGTKGCVTLIKPANLRFCRNQRCNMNSKHLFGLFFLRRKIKCFRSRGGSLGHNCPLWTGKHGLSAQRETLSRLFTKWGSHDFLGICSTLSQSKRIYFWKHN